MGTNWVHSSGPERNAYHEAAHAVVMYLYRQPVVDVYVAPGRSAEDAEGHRTWDWSYYHALARSSPEDSGVRAAIDCALMAASAGSVAEQILDGSGEIDVGPDLQARCHEAWIML